MRGPAVRCSVSGLTPGSVGIHGLFCTESSALTRSLRQIKLKTYDFYVHRHRTLTVDSEKAVNWIGLTEGCSSPRER